MRHSFSFFCLALFLFASVVNAENRTWKDSTGVFSVEAELVQVAKNSVILRKTDGKTITVPLAKLSKADQAYLRSRAAKAVNANEPADARIRGALEKDARFGFIDTPLTDVVAFVRDAYDINVIIDRRAFDEVGISSDTPITANIKGVSFAKALNRICKQSELDWYVDDEALVISSKEGGQEHVMPRVYRLSKPVDLDELIEGMTSNVFPESWADVGGPGAVQPVSSKVILVLQSEAAHRLIESHYDGLLEYVPPQVKKADFAKHIPAGIWTVKNCEVIETPLPDLVSYLEEAHNVQIEVDTNALDDTGIDINSPVTANLKNMSLRSILVHVLAQNDLTYISADEVILITTPENAEKRLQLVSHSLGKNLKTTDWRVLAEAITTTVDPSAWDQVGGPGSIRKGVRGTLDVRQTLLNQFTISEVLGAIDSIK